MSLDVKNRMGGNDHVQACPEASIKSIAITGRFPPGAKLAFWNPENFISGTGLRLPVFEPGIY